MRRLVRHLWPSAPRNVTVCEACAQACSAACRSAARFDRARTEALRRGLPR